MKKYLKNEAIELRKSGKSLSEISSILKISKGTASTWLKDVILNDTAKNILNDKNPANRNKISDFSREQAKKKIINMYKEIRIKYQNEGSLKAKENNLLHQAGCMLYWGEGSKSRNSLKFTNTDENMLVLFRKFLSNSLNIDNNLIYANVQIHNDNNNDDVKKFWEQKLSIQVCDIRKIKPRGNGRKNRHKFGIVTIFVRKSTKYCQHIFGAIQEYAGFDNQYCLF